MKRWVVGDFETASAVDLKQAGAWRYAQDPSTEVLCFAWDVQDSNLPRVWMAGASMEEVRETAPLVILDPDRLEYFINALCTDTEELHALASDPDVIWIAHNAAFEKAIWRHIMEPEFGMPPIPNTRWHDTQAVCAHRALPQKLDTVLQVLQLEHQKDMEGSKITLGMSKPDRKGYYNRSLTKRIRAALYCLDDIAGEVGLHRRLGWLPAMEQTVWLLNQRTNERGLKLDMDFVRQAQKVVDDASRPLLAEFSTLTGGFTPGQGKEFHKWLAKHDVTLPNLTKETIAELIGDDEGGDAYDNLPSPVDDAAPVRDLPDVVRRALRIKQLVGSASVKKLRRMEACVSLDGRARGLSQYHGSTPGRNTGRLLQPYNFPRGTLKIKGKDGKEKAPEPQLVVDAIMTGDYGYVEDALGAGAVEVVVSSLRHALVPNTGRVFISGDYAGIQARVVLAAAQQADKLAIFSDDRTGRKGADIYCDMAGQIYKRPITKNDMAERQTGKNCFAADTLVLTPRGYIPIVDVLSTDQLWDGIGWVNHDGVLSKGGKTVVSMLGIWATPEHPVWYGEQWHRWDHLAHDGSARSLALAQGSANLPLSGMFMENAGEYKIPSRNVPVVAQSEWSTLAICLLAGLRGVLGVQKCRLGIGVKNFTVTLTSYLTKITGSVCSTESAPSLAAATTRKINTIHTMANAASMFIPNGAGTGVRSWRILSLWKAGTNRLWNWTALKLTKAMSREICGSLRKKLTSTISDKCSPCSDVSWSWKPVFDLANAGPRHRFTILTDAGPIIVSNSVLGLGFQMGAKKFRLKYAKNDSLEFAEEIVRVYRKEWAPKVPDLWYGLQKAAVKCVHTGRTQDSHGIEYRMVGDALTARLPSGRLLWYQHPVATQEPMPWDVEDVRAAFAYHVMKMGQWKRVKAFGGLLTENIVMGIEVDIQRTAQIKCERAGFPVVLEVYDEVVVEPEIANADEKGFRQILLDVEPWVKQLEIPIAVETWSGDRYRK